MFMLCLIFNLWIWILVCQSMVWKSKILCDLPAWSTLRHSKLYRQRWWYLRCHQLCIDNPVFIPSNIFDCWYLAYCCFLYLDSNCPLLGIVLCWIADDYFFFLISFNLPVSIDGTIQAVSNTTGELHVSFSGTESNFNNNALYHWSNSR